MFLQPGRWPPELPGTVHSVTMMPNFTRRHNPYLRVLIMNIHVEATRAVSSSGDIDGVAGKFQRSIEVAILLWRARRA